MTFKQAKEQAMKEFENKYISDALLKHRWNITEAAEASDVNRKTFQRLISKHNIH